MVTTELTPATTPSTSARSISAVATSSVATSAQPGVPTIDPFGALMDQLGSNASTPVLTADPTVKTTPTVTPTIPAPVAQATPPGQQTLAPPLPGQATVAAASTAKQTTGTKGIVATTATADDPIEDDKPTDVTLVAISAPQPPVPAPAQPQAVSPLATPAGTNDFRLPADAATPGSGFQAAGTTQGYSSQQTPVTASEDGSHPAGPPLIAGPADKPADALVTAQAAATPSVTSQPARSTGRIQDDSPAKTTSTPPGKGIQETEQPGLDPSGFFPVVTTALPTVVPTQGIPSASPMPTAAAQPTPNQAASIAPAQSIRAAKMEPDSTVAPSEAKSASAAAPDAAPSTTSNVTPAAAPPVGAAGMSIAPSPTLVPEAARQVSARPASPPGSPASQVAQAIIEPVKVLMSSSSQAASTVSHITTIQIAPAELGRVDIRIERPVDGPATIQLIAERPETLSRLVHDQSQLHQALDQAGVPQAGRTLDFSLAPTATPDFAAASSSAGGAMNGGSSSSNGQQRKAGTYANQAFGTVDDTAAIATTSFRSIRTGIDITA